MPNNRNVRKKEYEKLVPGDARGTSENVESEDQRLILLIIGVPTLNALWYLDKIFYPYSPNLKLRNSGTS